MRSLITVLLSFFCLFSGSLFAKNPVMEAGPENSSLLGNAVFTEQEKAFLSRKKKVLMCVDPAWMPMEQIRNGKHEGISADFIKIMEKTIGIPIQLVVTDSWPQSIEFAKSRKCDIYSLAMSTPERLQYMKFTEPYLRLPLVLATRKENSYVSDVTLVTDKPIGVVSGYAFGEILRKRYPEMQIINVDSLKDGLNQVESGFLYGMIDTLASIGYQVQRGYPELKIAGKFDEYWELGVGVRNDEPFLYSVFEKAVAQISAKDSQAILNRWISVKYEQGFDYSLFWKSLPFLVLIVAFIIYRQSLLKKHNRELLALSETDALTRIGSRRLVDQKLCEHIENYRRYGHSFSVILFDLDHFKQVNDTYGHLIGDRTLVELCRRIEKRIRKVDIFGRWGGEEFLIICPGINTDQACILAEKLRQIIAEEPFAEIGTQTASFGIAECNNPHITPQSLTSMADKALYQAKEDGRNRCKIWPTPPKEKTTESVIQFKPKQ